MANKESQTTIGVVSFTDPRDLALAEEAEGYLKESHQELVGYLEGKGYRISDPHKLLKKTDGYFGVRSTREIERCIELLKQEGAACLIIGCWKWTEPQLVLRLVKELNIPVLLFTRLDSRWSGATCLTAVGASLWEGAPNRAALTHMRLADRMEGILPWVEGVGALARMNRASVMLFGGSYSLRMEHLQDDIPRLKSFLIGDILQSGEYPIILRADELLKKSPRRIESFIKWLSDNKARIIYDNKMMSSESFRKQVALYLAAKDLIAMDDPIIGISIKCQPHLSIHYGVDGCLIPAFMPFSEDAEGKKQIIPTVCEGDIKGLLTSCILHQLNPEIPPLFGDLKYVNDDYFIIANCGAASVYYAANSCRACDVLPNITISAQCQGSSGGAVHYRGRKCQVTVARLIRIAGHYIMQLGLGKGRDVDDKIMSEMLWGRMWPHVAVDLGITASDLLEVAGSNHYSLTTGDITAEITHLCREAAIPVLRLDHKEEIARFKAQLARQAGWQ
ncbi:hypothetical protein AUJ69_02980 [Candidatus Woesearchaeota archaeon CG1_02_47_18]|nr:MAG: hypothetical protein AUJ69_02980 [Candidatus Woesearchaeota archaeon CG1_02_47_18]HII30117.1 fucose isomerase [Candidatus Woesearchaeota archaeon]